MVMLIEQQNNGSHNSPPKTISSLLLTSTGPWQNKHKLCLFAVSHSQCPKTVEMPKTWKQNVITISILMTHIDDHSCLELIATSTTVETQ